MADKLTTGLAVACVALGVGAAYLGIQLLTERDRTSDAVAAREDAEARLHELESRLAQMPRRRSFEMREPPPVQSESEGPAQARAVENYSSGLQNGTPSPTRPLPNPSRQQGPRLNADVLLARTLKLDGKESEKLLEILNEEQKKFRDALKANPGRPLDQQSVDALRSQEDQRVRDLLGEDKYQEYKEYRRYESQHQQVNMLDQRLANVTGNGLTPQQESSLFTVLKEERDRVPQPTMSQYASRPEFMTAMDQWRTDYFQRTQTRAATVLTADQVPFFQGMRNFGGPLRGERP